MKTCIPVFCWSIVSFITLLAQEQSPFLHHLTPGNYTPGFRHEDRIDYSRSWLSPSDGRPVPRTIHAYTWYPSTQSNSERMRFSEYVRLADEDLGVREEDKKDDWPHIPIPVQLDKGMSRDELRTLWVTETASIRNSEPAKGRFPVIVLGQGLFYESPLSNFILCEYLASHGFVVITSPLVGTCYRLVNITPADVETQVRDMEFLISVAVAFPFVDRDRIGVSGFDLGGISGLLLCMRHPDVKAFLSLDCTILFPHYTGIPNTHPSYDEDSFTIPWMHIVQSRIFSGFFGPSTASTLYDRKRFGDNYLLLVSTTSHGDFTSYANLDITNPVPRYWNRVSQASRKVFRIVCDNALVFFEAYLKQKTGSLDHLKRLAVDENKDNALLEVRMRSGEEAPPSQSYIVNLIIEKGFEAALPVIKHARREYADSLLFDEKVMSWLGFHLLYRWGRDDEAVNLFKLMVSLFPNSANAYEGLGEAYRVLGDSDQAVKSYEKSFKLDPDREHTKEMLKQLREH